MATHDGARGNLGFSADPPRGGISNPGRNASCVLNSPSGSAHARIQVNVAAKDANVMGLVG